MSDSKSHVPEVIEFYDQLTLYRAYMPFIKEGGLFIKMSVEGISLGDPIITSILLPKAESPMPITGNVVWISPKKLVSEEGSSGLGIQFTGDNTSEVRTQIEEAIKEYLNSDQPTDTM